MSFLDVRRFDIRSKRKLYSISRILHFSLTVVIIASPLVAVFRLEVFPKAHAEIPTGNFSELNLSATGSTKEVISDGAGGQIAVWSDSGSLYAQKVDASGAKQWGGSGVSLSSASTLSDPKLLTDGSGGVIVVYDTSSSGGDVYMQRVNSAGVLQWGAAGTQVANQPGGTPGTLKNKNIISDGSGGAIFVYINNYENTPTLLNEVYAQRVNSSGATQWSSGVLVDSSYFCGDGASLTLGLTSDGSGGAIIAFNKCTESYPDLPSFPKFDVYTQRLNSSGVKQWGAGGILVADYLPDDASITGRYSVLSDGSGGAEVFWLKTLSDSSAQSLYGQGYNSSGTEQWTAGGVLIASGTITGYDPFNSTTSVSDGSGGAILVWSDATIHVSQGVILAQKLNSSGALQWGSGVTALNNPSFDDGLTSVISDGNGGIYLATERYDVPDYNSSDIIGQRLDSSGNVKWADGTAISADADYQFFGQLALDSNGNLLTVWDDNSNGVTTRAYSLLFQLSNIASGLDVVDTSDNSLKIGSGFGLTGTGQTVRLKDTGSGLLVAETAVNMTQDRNWNTVTGDADLSTHKSVTTNLSSVPGAAATHTLYVAKAGIDNAVYICPVATTLGQVSDSCTSGYQLTDADSNVAIVTIGGQDYWKIDDLTGTGGISINGTASGVKDTLTRLQVSTASNHSIQFTSTNGATASGDTIQVLFDPGGLNWDLSSIVLGDIDMDINNSAVTLGASAGASTWGTNINTGTDTITFTAPTSGTGYLPASGLVLVKIGTNATGGTNQIVNPAVVNSYEVHLIITNGFGTETGELEIPIIDDDTVNVTGYIDTFITFDIDTAATNLQCDAAGGTAPCDSYGGATDNTGYLVDLGEMTTSTVNKSGSTVSHADGGSGAINNIWFDLSSNASGGSVVRSYSLNNDLQGPGGSTIPSVGSGEVQITSGSSLYGLQHLSGDVSTVVSGTLTIDADCDATSGATYFCSVGGTSGRNILSTTAAVDTARVQLRVGASPNSLNTTGTYTDQLTFIATATF
jgi:hypothetical protein